VTTGRACARRGGPLLVLLLLLAGCASSPAERRTADLVNARLSPGLAQWLVGPVSHLATEDEVQHYLHLTDDVAARSFIDAFWQVRASTPLPLDDVSPLKPRPLRERFEARAVEADKRYSEAGYLGRRTDRGVVYVLYGPPASVTFDIDPQGGAPIERWHYADNAPNGYDGKAPLVQYSFRKQGDLTVFYHAPLSQTTPLRPGFP
jgi:GWxTD domain-containing protein